MTEPIPTHSNAPNDTQAVHRAGTELVLDDEDEPPSPNYRQGLSQVTNGAQAPVVSSTPGHASTPDASLDHDHLEEDQLPAAFTRGGLGMSHPCASRRSVRDTNAVAADTLPTVADVEKGQLRLPKTHHAHSRGSAASRLRALFTPTRPALGPRPTYMQSLRAMLMYSPLNICLVFIPISWGMHFSHTGNDTMVFIFSALGIIPLAALLGLGTEQIALKTSMSVGGLLNATLGNIVEMIIAGIALKKCELELVQSSLLGGLLSNLLLVLGMAFIIGGYRFHQQEFQPMVAQLNSSLMTVAVVSLIVPVAFHEYLEDKLAPGTEVTVLLQLSRGSAVILIFIYIAYLVFQFYSHNHLFLDTSQSVSSFSSRSFVSSETDPDDITRAPSPSSASSTSSYSSHETVRINTPSALGLLVATTALAYVTSECLVESLEGMTEAHPSISREWLTLIVIPIISNAAEHATAVVVASKGKFDLAMSVAVGSCIQISLFVIPVLVLVAWGMDKPLTLAFDSLETVVLFFSVILVKFAVEDGKSHWMNGVALVAVYMLIALAFWNFPDTARLIQGQPLPCH